MDLHSTITPTFVWIKWRSNTNSRWFLIATEPDVFQELPLLLTNLHDQVLEKPEGTS